MVVTASVVLVFVTGDAIMKSDFAGQAALGKKLKGAVDGGKADARIFLFHKAMKFVSGKMFSGFEEGSQDGIPLCGVLQSHALEVRVQDLLRLPHHLA